MEQSKNNHKHSFLCTYPSWMLDDLPTAVSEAILSSGSFCHALWIFSKVFYLKSVHLTIKYKTM